MVAKVPTKAAVDLANRLNALLALPFPPAHVDKAGYDAALTRLKREITANYGTFTEGWNGARMRAHGFASSSTEGLIGACRNWITQVTLKAASASMAGAA